MKRTIRPMLSKERALYLRQNKRRNLTVRLCRWGFLAAFLLAWEVAAEWEIIDSFIFVPIFLWGRTICGITYG